MTKHETITHEIKDEQLVSTIDGWYEIVTKDADGNPEVTKAYKHSTKTRPNPLNQEEIEHLLIRSAKPTILHPTKRQRTLPRNGDRTTLILPDMQIGYRGDEPFHDPRALELAQLAISHIMPDQIVVLGDNLDLPVFSKYEQRPDWQLTTQRSIDDFHGFLAQIKVNAPDTIINVLEGNHDERLARSIRRNNAELLNLKRAGEKLGALSLRSLLNTDALGVNYISGYPNGQFWIENHLKAAHGTVVRSGGSTAGSIVNKEDTSTIFGHVHRSELAYRTIPQREGSRQIYALCPGTLSRIDGGVPSGDYTTDEYNNTVLKAPNWQQGIGLIFHNERNSKPYILPINEDGIDILGSRISHPSDALAA